MTSVKSFHESFYGTPTVDESRRRRGKKRRPAVKEEPQNEVAVIGIHYRSFDDDSMATFVNSATALVPWNGDSKLLIDRYDVRHLLQDLTGIRRRRARPPSPDATKEELDYERYRDVEGLENPSSTEEEQLKDENATGGGYQRVGFDYSTGGDQSTQKERVEDAIFSPPFFVPEHLRTLILKMGPGCGVLKSVSLLQADERGNVQPTSTKVHQIMAGTAKYVIEHGGQAEIVLRVKQANNPTFGFLMPDHYDHDYFRFLVAHPEHVGIGPASQPVIAEVTARASSEEAEGGLSLLGTAYGDADEDEGEDEEGDVSVDRAQEERAVVAVEEVPESVDNVMKQQSDGSSGNGTTSKRSSTLNQTTSDVAENATKDTGDSHDTALGSEFPGNIDHEEAGEVPVDGNVDTSPLLQEPSPPGMEASDSKEAEAQDVHISPGGHDYQAPPYKEPPIHLRRIIDKMVEFISRNGKEFEAIVKERDKTDRRFLFFLPWNEYYPYYSQELEAARQVHTSGGTAISVPSTSEPLNAMEEQGAEKDQGHDSFLNGVPFWDDSWTVESKGNVEGEVTDMQDFMKENSHTGEGGMGFDAVLAAVHAATRGRPPLPVEGGEEADLPRVSDANEHPEMGSDEAVLAAIRAATGRTNIDSSGSDGKGETVQRGESSGASTSIARDPNQTATSPPSSKAGVPVGLDGDDVRLGHVVSKAVAGGDTDLSEPALAPHEKRKAERLKKAKLFAAMIKDSNRDMTNPAQVSGWLGTSMSSSDRFNLAGVTLENASATAAGEETIKTCPPIGSESREQIGETQLQVGGAHETEKRLVGSGDKERKHKEKSKEQDGKQSKHRHRRKKDTEERENDNSVHSPEIEEMRKDKHHDHYQEGKKKDKKRGHLYEGKMKDKVGGQEFEDDRKEYEEARKDRSYKAHDSERKRKESKYEREEGSLKESRHGRDSEEKRRDDRYIYDAEQKRRDRKHRYDLEERRSGGSRYGYDLEEREERSHSHSRGKRRKHKDTLDESDEKDGRSDRRAKKSRRHGDDTPVERQSTHQGDGKEDKRPGEVISMNQDPSGGLAEQKPGLEPIVVPDDIRAKVRAMLAMI